MNHSRGSPFVRWISAHDVTPIALAAFVLVTRDAGTPACRRLTAPESEIRLEPFEATAQARSAGAVPVRAHGTVWGERLDGIGLVAVGHREAGSHPRATRRHRPPRGPPHAVHSRRGCT